MIAMPTRLPMLQWDDQKCLPLSESWMTESVQWSARQAGYPQWEWTGDVVKALTYYLEKEYDTLTISRDQLVELMTLSIQSIGYREIAEQASLVAPRITIHLPDIARQHPWELAFFQQLQQELHEAGNSLSRGIYLMGIRPCVKLLRGSRRWHPQCQHLNDEIVSYSRGILLDRTQPSVDLVIR